MIKSILNISDLKASEILKIISLEESNSLLPKKSIGLIFEKPSTRTRISFFVGLHELGLTPIDIKFEELNISREESFEDTFRALNCYLDGLIYRTTDHNKLLMAQNYFDKPIINALSDLSHPCQILSDLYTINEQFGKISIPVLWVGDLNNITYSLVEVANLFPELELYIYSPMEIINNHNWNTNSNIHFVDKLQNINLKKIKCVMTDVHISMNDKNSDEKKLLLNPFIVDQSLMNSTSDDSVFMHCLPAKIGNEVTQEVFTSPKSIVWKQARNRLIVQKKILRLIEWN